MSELINNRETRRKVLKDLISELHAGKSVEDVKERFEASFGGVASSEISEVEQSLIDEGMPVSEVQRLCDVHASVFKGSIEEIHASKKEPAEQPGHPVHTLKRENRALEHLIDESIQPHLHTWLDTGSAHDLAALQKDLALLSQVDIHYKKKENLLFPLLEKHGITAPPKVMWGVDDEIRHLVKDGVKALSEADRAEARRSIEAATDRIEEMIFKEENILFPMMLETLSVEEWKQIYGQTGEIGYCLLPSVAEWSVAVSEPKLLIKEAKSASFGTIVMPSGALKPVEIVRLLDTLPLDITFVDKDDKVQYFSQGKDRIFARTTTIIGRQVSDCHPPASVHVVEKIVADFKSGAKDHEDFWIRMGKRFVYIRYFAVRSGKGEYLGTLEVTQDIAPIQELQGEKRLMSD